MDKNELRGHLTGETMKNKAKKQGEIWWCIKSGRVVLPYTARLTRKACIAQYENLFMDDVVVRLRVVEEKKGVKP